MAAKNGAPVFTKPNLGKPDGPEFEVHEPESVALLAVCPECGFEFDSDHQVADGDGKIGYECPRCLNEAFLKARESAIAEAVVAGVCAQHSALVHRLREAERELAHIRPQNALLKRGCLGLETELAVACRELGFGDDLDAWRRHMGMPTPSNSGEHGK